MEKGICPVCFGVHSVKLVDRRKDLPLHVVRHRMETHKAIAGLNCGGAGLIPRQLIVETEDKQ